MINRAGDIRAEGNAIVRVGDNNLINNHYKTGKKSKQDAIDECLSDLRRPTDPRQDKSRIERTKGGLLVDSCQWVLHSPEFQQWRDDDECRLLWVKGDPGKGKTMLLCGIIDELEPLTRLKDPNSQVFMSYFFCEATNSNISNATAVLRGLVYLLALQQPSLTSWVPKKPQDEDIDHWNSFESISQSFFGMMEDLYMDDIYFIIDALDECTTDLDLLLDIIPKYSSSRVKWIVSSRNHRNIEELISSVSQKNPLSLELNNESVSAAVSAFIEHRVIELAKRKRCKDETAFFIQTYLNRHAGGTFLWVALACSALERTPVWNMKKLVQDFPPGLHLLYKRMMLQIKDSTTAELCQRVLGISMTVYQPITIKELASLETTIDDLKDIPSIVAECGSFLTIRDEIIYFIHQSAKEFLVQEIGQQHYLLFQRSLEVMNVIGHDMYNLIHPGTTLGEALSHRPDPDPLVSVRYSCVYWADHLLDAYQSAKAKGNSDLVRQIMEQGGLKKFINGKILFWVEALSLFQALSSGVSALSKLSQLFKSQCQSDADGELLTLIIDTYKLIQYFRPCIEEYPLQTYISGLVFSPKRSLVRSRFLKYAPSWLETKSELETDIETDETYQGDCLQVLQAGGKVSEVSFSPAGLQLAALTKDGSVKKWDAIDGASQPMQQEKSKAMALSSDWLWLATVSKKGVLEVWDYETNTVKWSKSGCINIGYVAFSPDSQCLAISGHVTVDHGYICEDEYSLQLWDTRTHTTQKWRLGNAARNITFSSDGKLMAIDLTVSPSRTLLFGVHTGKEHGPIMGSTWAFLPNSRKLVLATEANGNSNEVSLWDVESGTLKKCFSIWDPIERMALSPDSKLLVLATLSAVRLYDNTTFTLLQHLPAKFYPVTSLAVSSTNERLAVGCVDGTVWQWDLPSLMARPPDSPKPATKASPISNISLFASKNLLASAFEDETVRVWNTDTGRLLSMFQQRGWVQSLIWSSDGHLLAVKSSTGIKLCDPVTGRIISSLPKSPSLTCVAVSPGPPPAPQPQPGGLAQRVWDKIKLQLSYKRDLPFEIYHTLPSRWTFRESMSDDGHLIHPWVATSQNDKSMYLWDPSRGKMKKSFDLSSHFSGPYCDINFTFSPSGHLMAIAGLTVNAEARDKTTNVTLFLGDIMADNWRRMESATTSSRPSCKTLSFSPSGQSVMVTGEGRLIIWDVETGDLVFQVQANDALFFNDSSIITQRGMIQFNQDTVATRTTRESEKQEATLGYLGCGISHDLCWVTWNEHPVLWLPVEYQPRISLACQAWTNEVFIGSQSGQLSIMRFSPTLLQTLLERVRTIEQCG